jgi:uncharacterized repeat protein (TIGR03943 family)
VTEDTRATTILLVGALLVRLSISGAYAKYVRAGMAVPLLTAGVLLVALGLIGVVRALRSEGVPRAHGDHSLIEGSHPPTGAAHADHARTGWLLLVPVLALLLVTPPSLGSFGVDRGAAVKVTSGGKTFAPLPAGRTVPMSLLEFDQRAADHNGASFGSATVRLTGFVTGATERNGFRIARYQIACCAADAVASVVRVTGTSGNPPSRDQWVTVTGTFQRSADEVPELRAASLTEVPDPADPYE